MKKQYINTLKDKKILYVHKSGQGWGGAQQGIYDLVNFFQYRFNKAIFVCNQSDLMLKLNQKKIRTYQLPEYSVYFLPVIILRLIKIIIRERPDVIHSNHRYPTLLIQLLRKVLPVNFKVIHTARSVFDTNTIFNNLGDKIIAISHSVQKNLVKDFKIPSEKIDVIYNGIKYKPADINSISDDIELTNLKSSGKIVIGSIGGLVKAKGHLYLFQALEKLPQTIKDKIIVLVAGDGYLRQELEETVVKFQLSETVKFLGYRDDIGFILDICNFIAISSIQEGQSRVLVEAYSHEKPPVTFGLDFAYEFIRNNETGIIVPLLDINAYAEAIELFVRNPNLVRQFGAKGKQSLSNKFSLPKMYINYQNAYQTLLSDLN